MDYDTWLEEPYQRQAAAEEAFERAVEAEVEGIWSDAQDLGEVVGDAIYAQPALVVGGLQRWHNAQSEEERNAALASLGAWVAQIAVDALDAEATRRAENREDGDDGE